MNTRNVKRLLAVLEYITETNTNEETVVLATTAPYLPDLTLGDIKETITDLKQLMHAREVIDNLKSLLQ
jgi:predicted component of type VI protein secretion system